MVFGCYIGFGGLGFPSNVRARLLQAVVPPWLTYLDYVFFLAGASAVFAGRGRISQSFALWCDRSHHLPLGPFPSLIIGAL